MDKQQSKISNSDARVVIISGLSGSGKSVALHRLEDLGYYAIDNIPAGLLSQLLDQLINKQDPLYQQLAIGLDARNKADELAEVPKLANELRTKGIQTDVLFLTTDSDILIKRYSETRRRHPLSTENRSLEDAIQLEKNLLQPISDTADKIFDTTRTTIHELRDMLANRIHTRLPRTLSLLFKSFGFKHGVPMDADYVFDVRCLPNPYWEPALRQFTGLDEPVQEFLGQQELVKNMIHDIRLFLNPWIPQFIKNNRSYLTIAIGCTGGQHRSVFIAEQLHKIFSEKYAQVLVRHNELKIQLELDNLTKERFLGL